MKMFSVLAAIAITFNVALAPAPSDQLSQARALLEGAQRELAANAAAIDRLSGLTAVLHARLAAHLAQLQTSDDPEATLQLAQLDRALVDQLAQQTYPALDTIHGASAALVPAIGVKKLAYPLALYVPATAGDKPATLIIYLHGKGQSEADVIASPLVRSLADATGSVVIAPYAGGDDMLADATIADLYQTLGAIETSLRVDRRRVYLAGNSLGGFAAFKALAAAPDRWSSLLVIEGAVAQTDSDAVAQHVRGKPVYLVGGSEDGSITSAYLRQLAAWLSSHGALVTYYEQPGGTHSLASVAPMASKAWRDMLAGVASSGTIQEVIPPGPTMKPHPN
ncbi:MAG TPA: hypothetical protein VKF82_12575 [Candidatus Eremiobacteraceae bacterium]|nr:hypothetical protein [Candidatus Eremiobacteraceae bacterium]